VKNIGTIGGPWYKSRCDGRIPAPLRRRRLSSLSTPICATPSSGTHVRMSIPAPSLCPYCHVNSLHASARIVSQLHETFFTFTRLSSWRHDAQGSINQPLPSSFHFTTTTYGSSQHSSFFRCRTTTSSVSTCRALVRGSRLDVSYPPVVFCSAGSPGKFREGPVA
jgi:hypothetical protein